MKKRIVKFWKHYIKGEYHCDSCPYSWSEYSPACGDWDAGCIIKGDIADDGCRLLPPFRALIGWFKGKQRNYYLEHEYDDYPAYIEKEQREVDQLKEGIKQHVLLGSDLYYTSGLPSESKMLDNERMEVLLSNVWQIRNEYENVAHPFAYKSLSLEWQELIAKTVRRKFIEPFLPFLPQKRKRRT